MQKIQLLSGLTLLYDESEKEKINKIAAFIKKNSFMFSDFENGNNNETININDFNQLVENIVMQFTNEGNIKQTIESDDFLPSMYLAYLILKNEKTNDTLIQLPSNTTIELILFFLSIKYYNYDVSKICKALFSPTSIEYKEIIEQLKNEQRINIYNYYLKCASGFLEEYDSSMLDNLEAIIEKLTQMNFEYAKSLSSQNSKLDNLKQLSKEEFDRLVQSFLIYIDAPKKWFNYYEHLKNNNLINFEYSTEIDYGELFFDNNDKIWKINLISDGTIRTFITFIHEFIHYVVAEQNPNINYSLLEFPPIYFENIAAEFSKDSGYEEEIIEEVLNVRNANNFNLYGSQIFQLKDILDYKKYGPFSIEKRIDFYRNWIESMNNFKITMVRILKDAGEHEIPDFLQTLEEREPAELAYNEIDEKIDAFIQSGLLVLNGYQYLVGSLLSFNILNTTKRNYGNENMINVTNQLGNHSIDSIMQLFCIALSCNQNSTNDNGNQKKLVSNSTNDN